MYPVYNIFKKCTGHIQANQKSKQSCYKPSITHIPSTRTDNCLLACLFLDKRKGKNEFIPAAVDLTRPDTDHLASVRYYPMVNVQAERSVMIFFLETLSSNLNKKKRGVCYCLVQSLLTGRINSTLTQLLHRKVRKVRDEMSRPYCPDTKKGQTMYYKTKIEFK